VSDYYAFGKNTAHRLAQIAGRYSSQAEGANYEEMPLVPLAQMAIAQTSSTITARSGTTLGSGTATLYDCSGGTLTATSISETVYNLSTTSIATSRYVMIQREYITGLWLVVYEDC